MTSDLSRRSALLGIGLAGATGMPPIAAIAQSGSADAAILAAWNSYRHKVLAFDNGGADSDPDGTAFCASIEPDQNLLEVAQPTSLAGVVALLRYALDHTAAKAAPQDANLLEDNRALAGLVDEFDDDGPMLARVILALVADGRA